jgi:PAS domain S-box-containing protein
VAVLAIFMVLESITIVSQQKKILQRQAIGHTYHEMEIIAAAMRSYILLDNYADVKQILAHWGEEHDEITIARAIAPNGFVLAEYSSETTSKIPFELEYTLKQNNRDLLFIKVVGDLSTLDKTLASINLRMFAGSIFFVILMGTALWFTQRAVTLNPLEREITKRSETEKELKRSQEILETNVKERTGELIQSEHSYRTLAVNLPGIVYRVMLDKSHKVTFFNETVRAMTGFAFDTLDFESLKAYWDRVPAEDVTSVRKKVRQALKDNIPYEIEYRFLHASGGTRYFIERGRPIMENGRPVQIDGVVLDITASRASEKEAKRLYSTLDTLVNNIPIGIILLDGDYKIVLVNPVGENYLYMLSESREGDVLSTLADRPLSELLISPPLLVTHEIKTLGSDGRTILFDVAASTIRSDRGIDGIIVMLKDVTEEHELRQWAQTHERLASVGQLAAGIAHDFSNVLTCIVGFSEMLLTESSIPQDALRQIRAIHESGQRGADLIAQIMDFSRSSMDERKPINLLVTVQDFMKFLDRLIPENIDVKINSKEGDHTVIADTTKLHQVFANLAVNARDAMPDGGELEFCIRNVKAEDIPVDAGASEKPESDWVLLKVSDTGEGVSEELKKHIFDPFFTTKGPGHGTGLGLAQVYGIVTQHKGHITLESTPGEGTTFNIYLPSAIEKVFETPTESEPAALPKRQGKNILVVEDDAVVRDLMVTVLEEMGHTCIEGGNGLEGLQEYKNNSDKIALVVTDLIMPEMNGIQMSKSIREINPDINIVAVSGYPPKDEDITESLFSAFIKKPFKALSFAREVDNMLKEKS